MDLPRSATATCTCRRFMGLLLAFGRDRRDAAVRALAAVLGEITEQSVHGAVVGGLVEGAAVAPRGDEPGMAQARQVEGECGGRELEFVTDGAHRQALGPRLHQQAVD